MNSVIQCLRGSKKIISHSRLLMQEVFYDKIIGREK
jgi:hypothetical protein